MKSINTGLPCANSASTALADHDAHCPFSETDEPDAKFAYANFVACSAYHVAQTNSTKLMSRATHCVRLGFTGTDQRPYTHAAMLVVNKAINTAITASTPPRRPATSARKTTAAISKKPINCFTDSIHTPGFGKYATNFGKIDKNKNGEASPRPITPKINKPVIASACTAIPLTDATSGPMHGAPTTAANTPIPNEPSASLRCDTFVSAPTRLVPISNTPIKLSAKRKNTIVRTTTKLGLCN